MNPNNPEFQDFINHMSENALMALRHAEALSRAVGSAYIGTEHVLLGIMAQKTSTGAKILEKYGITIEKAQLTIKTDPRKIPTQVGTKGLSEASKLTLKMAYDMSQEYADEFTGTEHVLYALLTQKNASSSNLMKQFDVNADDVLNTIEETLMRESNSMSTAGGTKTKPRRGGKSTLDVYGIDLNEKARAGKLDPVVGRDPEIKRMITILNRRSKNNPVLIGEPGVGKTAIVEGLAQRIIEEKVPDSMLETRIVMLDLAAMVAGTKYRGEFEERLKKVMKELEDDKSTVIFIDEIHLLVGAGAAEGSMDAGNILKPALSRGKIQVIGATTSNEYTKYIEKDSALERRFQPIKVRESTNEETLAILRGLRDTYEKYHNVKFSDEVLQDIVGLSSRYIRDRFMPDKAIDVLDETAATIRVIKGKTPPKVREIRKEISALSAKIEEAVESESYEKAAKYKQKVSTLEDEMKAIEKNTGATKATRITSDHVAEVVSRMSGVPVTKVAKNELANLMKLEDRIKERIIGQDEAAKEVAKAIRRSRSGIASGKRPIGSFVFLGPTGVGKTELARVVAEEYFGSTDSLIKIDMSEYSEKFNVSKLIGAPAGYVGYDDSSQLTDKIRKQPYSVVLFDEIEKAHPEIYNILLQILEDGNLTDSKGRKIDFSNSIVVMTSNVGADKIANAGNLGFTSGVIEDTERARSLMQEGLKKIMRPELINRIDKVLVFNQLGKPEIRKIIDTQIYELNNRLSKKGIAVSLTDSAYDYMITEGYDKKFGARPMRRLIVDKIEDHIAHEMLTGNYLKGTVIKVGSSDQEMTFKIAKNQ